MSKVIPMDNSLSVSMVLAMRLAHWNCAWAEGANRATQIAHPEKSIIKETGLFRPPLFP